MLILVTGGARSGKSRYAEEVARFLGEEPQYCCYLATGVAFDEEMKARIAKHQASRGANFFTVEEPIQLAEACQKIPDSTKVVLVDCLTTWLGNLSYRWELQHAAEPELPFNVEASAEIAAWLAYAQQAPHHIVMVSNELGMGLVPADAMSRAFRDAQGRLNQKVAACADRVVFMVSGLPLAVKGELPL